MPPQKRIIFFLLFLNFVWRTICQHMSEEQRLVNFFQMDFNYTFDVFPLNETTRKLFARMDFTKAQLNVFWQRLKLNKTALTHEDLLDLGFLLKYLPESQYRYINITDPLTLKYLGTAGSKFLSRANLALLCDMYFGPLQKVTIKVSAINKINGILCGCPAPNITLTDVEHINPIVFYYLYSCPNTVLRILYDLIVQSPYIGPPMVWKRSTLTDLGLLPLSMTPEEIKQIRPIAMKGISIETLLLFSTDQINAITPEQANEFDNEAYLIYKRVNVLLGRAAKNRQGILNYILLLILIYYLKKDLV